MRKLVSVKELAESLRVSKSKVYLDVENKRIPYIDLNGKIVFDPLEIEKWLQTRKVKTKQIA